MSASIITIDGPSGVGKGTLAQQLAQFLGFHFLDSGALYRLTAVNALRLSLDPEIADQAAQAVVADLAVEFKADRVFLHGKDVSETIRTLSIGRAASKVAAHPAVRNKLSHFIQSFVREPGIVADGRDMGTVVFEKADLKIFLMASPEIRAKRRYKQLSEQGKDVNIMKVFSELDERDKRDRDRDLAPLEPAKDAVLIDTDNLDEQQVFEKVKTQVALCGVLP